MSLCMSLNLDHGLKLGMSLGLQIAIMQGNIGVVIMAREARDGGAWRYCFFQIKRRKPINRPTP